MQKLPSTGLEKPDSDCKVFSARLQSPCWAVGSDHVCNDLLPRVCNAAAWSGEDPEQAAEASTLKVINEKSELVLYDEDESLI